jgi:tetratricopeptide (TPR) repeat protein
MKWMFLFFFVALVSFSNLIFSCKAEADKVVELKKDTLINDFNKIASRDPKKFVSDCRSLFSEARRMDSILHGETEIETGKANQAIEAFTDFSYYCASDTLAPVFLIKTAQVARSIQNIPQAKKVLDKCINDYPNFKDRPAAIFLLAQLYDEPGYLNNEYEAKKLYEKIIQEFPKSDWAESARGALMFIGKNDEEMLREIKKKNRS